MLRRVFSKLLSVAIVVLSLLALCGPVMAQGNRDEAFARVLEVQRIHTARLMAIKGVEGTAVGLNQNDQPALHIYTARPGVAGLPNALDGVPVRVVVTGEFFALPKPTDKPGKPGGGGGKGPKAPTGLTAEAVSDTQIYLDWNDNKGRGVQGYNVYRSTSSGSYEPDNLIAELVQQSNYLDEDLTASITYYYVVRAIEDGKESANSNEASATTWDVPGEPQPPAAPTNLTAEAVSSSQINLVWDDKSNNEDGFKIERDSVQIAMVGVNETSYSDMDVEPSITYTYRVRAYNGVSNSAYSNEASATTDDVPVEHPPLWCERPVPIGVSTGHPSITAGTIACRVKKGGNVYALSNNHVYANSNDAQIDDNVLQPGAYDGGQDPRDAIGTLAEFQEIDFDGGNNTIDAAIALSSTDNLGNATPAGSYGTPKSTPYPPGEDYISLLNLVVQKHGRTTGLTYGGVFSVMATLDVHYEGPGEPPKVATFVEQMIIVEQNLGYFSQGGDSGSLIVSYPDKQPVGLLFAGGSLYGVIPVTIANPIDQVLDHFGVTIDGE